MGTVKRKIDALYQDTRLLRTWGLELGASRLFLDCFTAEQRQKSSILQEIGNKRQELVEEKIEKYYPDIGHAVTTASEAGIARDCPIWVFWWQGLDNAPQLVKVCVDSIYKNSGEHPVNIIDKDNISSYIDLPDYVTEKLKAGKMTITHFSDILRFALLYKYGGIWMDATIYISRSFDDEIYENPLFTIKAKNPSGRKWTSFFWAASPGNRNIGMIRDFFYMYWEQEEGLIDYFLINSIISVAYKRNDEFKKALDAIPPSNEDVMAMFTQLNQAYNTLQISSDTYINKLSYKRNWLEKTPKGEMTVYGALVRKPSFF